MRPYPVALLLSSSFLLCLGGGWAWGDTDKTIVDLERGPTALAARYSRPRGARLYRYDKTELDVATPVTDQASEEQAARPSPNTTYEAAPATGPHIRLTSPSHSNR